MMISTRTLAYDKMYATGVKEIDQVLRGLPLQLTEKVLQNSFADAAKPMVEAIKSYTPTGETDNLIDSIGITKERSLSSSRAVGEIQLGPRRKGRYKGHIGQIINFGTGPRETKSGANRGSVPANPFMEKGYNQTKDPVLGRINTSIGGKLIAFMKRTIKNS